MLRFLRAGFTAALLQLAAVTALTAVVFPLRGLCVEISTPGSGPDISRISTPRLLVFAYLAIAAGVAMTNNRSIGLTTKHIRRASRKMAPMMPGRASQFLLAQSGFAAVLFAVVALRPPPDILVDAARTLGCDGAAQLVWAGVMSTAAACFGATTQAAFRAR